MRLFSGTAALPLTANRRLQMAAAGSVASVVGFAPIPLGFLLAAPGRGSETVILANILGPGLLAIALGLGTQGYGFLVLPGDQVVSRVIARAMIVDALAVALLGIVLLTDRFPCDEGLYCSGQVLGSVGRLTIYVWMPVVGTGYLFAGALALGETTTRRSHPFMAGTGLLMVDGLVLLGCFAALFLLFNSIAGALVLLGCGLGVAANAVLAASFHQTAKSSSPSPRPD